MNTQQKHSEKLFWRRGFYRRASKFQWRDKLRNFYSVLPAYKYGTAEPYLKQAEVIVQLGESLLEISDEQLQEDLQKHAQIYALFRETEQDSLMATALIRESAGRILGMRHHLVQLAGGLALAGNTIAEMATGEGKTLTSVIPIILNAWRQRGVHVFTANEYLVERDATDLTPLYKFCGLTTSFLKQDQQPRERIRAYQCDIVYATQKDIAADFLKDSLELKKYSELNHYLIDGMNSYQKPNLLNPKGLNFAVIDEIDSLLIDEADTPLILSGPGKEHRQHDDFEQAIALARCLEEGRHFRLKQNKAGQELELNSDARAVIREKTKDLEGLWKGPKRSEELVMTALKALHLFHNGKEYIIDDGEIVIVDQKTGRLMPDRTWQRGLQQMVEAKEGLEIQAENKTFAKITFQDFFRLYDQVCGLTGTASEAATELASTYKLKTVAIPLHQEGRRAILPFEIYQSEEEQLAQVEGIIRQKLENKQAIFLAVNTVQESDDLATWLRAKEFQFEVLNAKEHLREAEIVASAGQTGRLTVCTNMAGRGTDIKLSTEVKQRGGLHIISLYATESSRVERQLAGRCARQGDPGAFQKIYCLADPLLKEQLGFLKKSLAKWIPSSAYKRKLFHSAVHLAEKKARQRRKHVQENNQSFLRTLLSKE